MSVIYTNVFKYGDEIRVRGYHADSGVRLRKPHVVQYHPTLYYPTKKPTEKKSLQGRYLRAHQFATMREAYASIESNQSTSNPVFGMDKFITAYIHDEWRGEVDGDFSKVRVAYLDIETTGDYGFPDHLDPVERITAITVKINGEITSFGMGEFAPRAGVRYIRGTGPTEDIAEQQMLLRFLAFWFAADIDIVSGWHVRGFDIPYLYARIQRVVDGLDTPAVSKKPFEFKADMLSPYGIVRKKIDTFKGKISVVYDVMGISILDYLLLYRAHGTNEPMENFKLDTIAHHELGRGKANLDEIGGIKHAHRRNHQRFIEYNILDVELVEDLEKKKRLIEMIVSLAWMTRVNFEDVLHQTRVWDSIIYGHLLEKGVVVPIPPKQDERDSKYRGAYVLPPRTGMHKWIVSFDLNSLYPHLIMQYNIGPETLVPGPPINDLVNPLNPRDADYGVEKIISGKFKYTGNHVCAANGHEFRRDIRSFLSELMEYFYGLRKTKKSAMIEAWKKYQETHIAAYKDEAERLGIVQNAIKVLLNSAYGACGNAHFRFFDVRLAEAITLSGRLAIQWIVNKLEHWIAARVETTRTSFAIAADTDSVYLSLDEWVKEYCPRTDRDGIVDFLADAADNIFQTTINAAYTELAQIMRAYAQKMVMKRESIADIGVWSAKKRYILNVLDDEGVRYKKPKIKMVGVEAKRSTFPTIIRDKMKNCYKLILQGTEDELQHYANLFKNRMMLEDGAKSYRIEDIAIPSGISDVDVPAFTRLTVNPFLDDGDDSDENEEQLNEKGLSIHVKAAARYNQWLKSNNQQGLLYEPISAGSKMKYVFTRHDGVFGFSEILPPESGKRSTVDRAKHFKKLFSDPMEALAKFRGWNLFPTNNVDDFLDVREDFVETKFKKQRRKKTVI